MLFEKINLLDDWKAPELSENMPKGDMPGDKIEINEAHILKAKLIFSELIKIIKTSYKDKEKLVITVCGGSGVGKSETASLLSYYFNKAGIGAYTLSGDNYPRRIPLYNDAERLNIFRRSAIRGMVEDGLFSEERFKVIQKYQLQGMDADPGNTEKYPWMKSYFVHGREGLKGYLGSNDEIDFDELTSIVDKFKSGEEKLWMKRMGRKDDELWYEAIDCKNIQVLIIEWTHGNSDNYKGVDIPIFLNSTPKETLEHRKSRNRDGAVDSPFTTMVLELEQAMLAKQAHKAKIIVSKKGELLSYEEYCTLMETEKMSL